ncbi:MAG: hypothetical protein GXO74_10495 [Calditrichaeota bacterium]|nr:hypothetical protein [Calditrichota bacterium]
MLITFFYAIFGGVLFLIALLNSGFKIFGKETNKSDAAFLIVAYLFGAFFLAAGIVLTVMERTEAVQNPVQIAANQSIATKNRPVKSIGNKTSAEEAKKVAEKKESEIQQKAATAKSTQKKPTATSTPQRKKSFVFSASDQSWAQITTADKFVSCSDVRNRMPVGITDRFTAGERIFVWAQIYAPRPSERVELAWYDSNGNVIATKSYTIYQNLGDGYRIYYWKILSPGRYTVSLFNGKGEEIGRIAINVD